MNTRKLGYRKADWLRLARPISEAEEQRWWGQLDDLDGIRSVWEERAPRLMAEIARLRAQLELPATAQQGGERR